MGTPMTFVHQMYVPHGMCMSGGGFCLTGDFCPEMRLQIWHANIKHFSAGDIACCCLWIVYVLGLTIFMYIISAPLLEEWVQMLDMAYNCSSKVQD